METILITDSDSDDSVEDRIQIENSNRNKPLPTDTTEIIDIKDSDSENCAEDPLKFSELDKIKLNKNLSNATNICDTDSYRRQSYKLPKSFYHLPNNVYFLNKCQPLIVKLVDCKKYPWYYRKHLKHLGRKNKISSKDTGTVQGSETFGKGSFDSLNTLYDMLFKTSKKKSSNGILAGILDKKTQINQQIPKKDQSMAHNLVKHITKKSLNEQLDLKKNKGLLGLKIVLPESQQNKIKPSSSTQQSTKEENTSQLNIKMIDKCDKNVLCSDTATNEEDEKCRLENVKKSQKKECGKIKKEVAKKQSIGCKSKTQCKLPISKSKTNEEASGKGNKTKNKICTINKETNSCLSQNKIPCPELAVQYKLPNKSINNYLSRNTFRLVNSAAQSGVTNGEMSNMQNFNTSENSTHVGENKLYLQSSHQEPIMVTEVTKKNSPLFHENIQIPNYYNFGQSKCFDRKLQPAIMRKSQPRVYTTKRNINWSALPVGTQNLSNQIIAGNFDDTGSNSNLLINDKVLDAPSIQSWHQTYFSDGINQNANMHQNAHNINIQNTCYNQVNISATPKMYPYFTLQTKARCNSNSVSQSETCWPQNYSHEPVIPPPPPPTVGAFNSNLQSIGPITTGDSVIGFNNNGIVRKINISEPKLPTQKQNAIMINNSKNYNNNYKPKHRILIEKIITQHFKSENPRRIPGLTSVLPENFDRNNKLYPELSKALSSGPKSTMAFKNVSEDEYLQTTSNLN